MEHSEFYRLFTHFWWLIFPLFWMIAGAARLWSRHSRANQLIELMKTYAAQGKEPPPEVLRALEGPFGRHGDMEGRKRHNYRNGWVPVCLFAALAIAFVMIAFHSRLGLPEEIAGMVFVAIIFVGLCVGFLVATLTRPRGDADLPPPK